MRYRRPVGCVHHIRLATVHQAPGLIVTILLFAAAVSIPAATLNTVGIPVHTVVATTITVMVVNSVRKARHAAAALSAAILPNVKPASAASVKSAAATLINNVVVMAVVVINPAIIAGIAKNAKLAEDVNLVFVKLLMQN